MYQLDNALNYTSSALVVRAVPYNSCMANKSIRVYDNNTPTVLTGCSLTVTHNSTTVTFSGDSASSLVVGKWIIVDSSTGTTSTAPSTEDKKHPVQITSITRSEDDSGSGTLEIDVPWTYTTSKTSPSKTFSSGWVYTYTLYECTSKSHEAAAIAIINSDNTLNSYRTAEEIYCNDVSTTEPVYNAPVFHFYAYGTGTYYNSLVIRGTRNTDMEKRFLDDNGDPLYKYMYMDIGIYYKDSSGNLTLREGPWTVSLIPRYYDGTKVIDLTSGQYIFIENVINDNSDLVRCVATIKDSLTGESISEFSELTALISGKDETDTEANRLADAEIRRRHVMSFLTSGGYTLLNGNDGGWKKENNEYKYDATTCQYDKAGNISMSTTYQGIIGLAYSGELFSDDKSISGLTEVLYPEFSPDYIVCGGYPSTIQVKAKDLAVSREDCLCLADTGYQADYEKDIESRQQDYPWNTWYAALYTQWRKMFDNYTGTSIWYSPVYHAIGRHLYCDTTYFIAEPVAGILKGAIEDSIKLTYKANHTERGDLIDYQLNPTIVEPQGTYFLTQRSTYKSLSVLQYLHVAKFVMYLTKNIPPLLKDILHRKATQYWISQANMRINTFLSSFLEGPTERYSILSSFSSTVEFDSTSSTLNVYITIVPIRSIEKINVTIAVA